MTNREAGLIRACIGCGRPGAWLCRTTRGENPGRNLRLCPQCAADPDWYVFVLVDREPLPIEAPAGRPLQLDLLAPCAGADGGGR